jgi:hypothetical protein
MSESSCKLSGSPVAGMGEFYYLLSNVYQERRAP